MINREISIASIILAMLYASSFVFSYGVSGYYGYPKEIISIDISQLLSSSFEFGTILLSFAALFNLRIKDQDIGFFTRIFVYIFVIIISMIPWVLISPKGYLMQHGYKGYFFAILILPITLIYLVNSFGDFLDGDYKFKSRTQIFVTVFSILAAFYISGWLSANNKSYLFKNDENKVLLAAYADKYIWGSCVNESAEYFVTKQDDGIKLKRVTGRDVDELKICFRRAE
ncbi:hypothetical protein [Serratia marcescens]|uniref:hypothetical protein n=1 Tax=Serratia marcescens TaxID=615 RepID=UPI002182902E|nr:hypothetical protein [Serratia marcescens]CAI2438553.1 Uncharacterised protein [Serratia marcescens]CAI2780857.1 Uncharacterised protein [Serratia marcescens]